MSADPDSVVVVVVTFPDEDTASRIAALLVQERLVACVNVLPPVHSIYRWKGAVETTHEVLALAKTRAAAVDDVIARIKALHPYEVPEIIALPVVTGLPTYLQWVLVETDPKTPKGPAS